ncbi:N-formylglutamate amidohydrolase [Humibacillus xanthopallidus]|uniref:N-formylglutamate amidohydrolase n=1 Tax=Humibacillus xanthopallidus TaxID=412689 RepID=A0A543I0V8_9MICO|nr:N-formylglutamate amidohydrolase [Humibacillus xanthopallidus]TQM64234.1 N-formylglutamate amidohydrolase [Humibacillus xanthopallidus]
MAQVGTFEQDHPGGLVWIPEGTTFGVDDIVFYRGKGEVPFEDVAPRIDLILTGPHATAAIPRELAPFLEPGLTQRQQHDFSDMTTSDLCKRWVEVDEHAVYVEFPHHRILFDPNRDWPADPEAGLRAFFERHDAQARGEKVSFNGVDSIRPISFSGVPFLRRPADDAEWAALMAVVTDLGSRGAQRYAQVRDDVIAQVFAAKCAHLHALDLDTATVADFNSARMLHVQCVHDTMNATVGPDGAVDHDKPRADWLPRIVSLGNRGDERGEPRPPATGGLLPLVDVPIIDAAQFRSLQQALAFAFEVPHDELDDALALNSPYLGAFECQQIGRLLRSLEPQGIVRHHSQEKVLSIRTGAYQAEFLRETLMGRTNVDHVRRPGTDWPETDHEHHADLTRRLTTAYDILRRWDYDVPATKAYAPPRFR